MATQKENSFSLHKVALYDKLISTNPDVERKGATNPYTSLNGNMFYAPYPPRRLSNSPPGKGKKNFIKKYKTKLQEAHGVVRKEYVVVPDSLLRKTNELKLYFDISYAYAKTLKPKPTTKSKK